MTASGGRGRGALSLVLVLLAGLLGLGPGPAAGQRIMGQVLDRDTGAPVEGALALLVSEAGEEEDGYLTNEQGRFLLRAPGPGRYTVRVERIGYETVTSEPVVLASAQITGVRLETAQTAIELEGLEVRGERRCVIRPGEGMEVARVWEEARKALAVQDWTDREGAYRYTLVNYQRELDPQTLRIRSEERKVARAVARNPIRSLPAEDLMENGFIRQLSSGDWNYFGPDASVLLSDAFLDTHCFRLTVDQDRPDDLGLAFEPVEERRVPDISGTLWLDWETAHLDVLEYRYTQVPHPEGKGWATGQVEFEELPNGAWIVRKWWIRMPLLAQDLSRSRAGSSGIWVHGVREAGGEITKISTLAEETILDSPVGAVQGTVWDSIHHRPMMDARVFLSGTQHGTRTDSVGRFLLEGLPEGRFTAAFSHPQLDSLGFYPPGVDVEVVAGEVSEVALGIPAEGSLFASVCPSQGRGEGQAVLTGRVLATQDGNPVPSAAVQVRWEGYEVSPAGEMILEMGKQAEATTDGRGRYTICGVPADEEVAVQASYLGNESPVRRLRIEEGGYAVVDLELTLPSGVIR